VWHEQQGNREGACIFREMVAWMVTHRPALKAEV
jgi:hypothetical protein